MDNLSNHKIIGNKFIFQFIEDITNSSFNNKTSWGFEVKNVRDDIKTPRWGKVVKVGHTVESLNVNDYVLIEPLMWTHGFEIEGTKYWCSATEKIIGHMEQEPTGIF